ncbi:hypothetical protein N825_33970 [Skermanella stibiiresistens SB22]|uniref:Uncharacterized protein n=1 Tax=Skermanella stibiiresistens SB22 TaxID=1385369 RepID=W9H8C7_9PROT|nr:hypothetical protein N825_33970 [Skermanella stibiiresistens SB22]
MKAGPREILLADRRYRQPDAIKVRLASGADVLILPT